MLTNKHLQSWGIPSESTLLLPPEYCPFLGGDLSVGWTRLLFLAFVLCSTLSLTPFLNVANTSLQM